MNPKVLAIREAAEADLATFIKLIHPQRELGAVHRDVINWWTRSEAKSHQLLLLPRDHMKSALTAYRVAWRITKDPAVRILYISSTANLAEKQLKFIKDILTSDKYRLYWPEMVHPDEGKREKWTATEISVDHPIRRSEAIRDPTVFTGGLTTSLTGLHCDVAVLDDIVVYENAYTEEGREKVSSQYSLLSSIEGAESEEWVAGTRYHSKDLYGVLMEKNVELFDDEGELITSEPLFEVYQAQVESNGDGTGEYLWPRQLRADGKPFGFDAKILAKKKAQYLDQTQFRAQYYNDPNDTGSSPIQRDMFQYYEPGFLRRSNGYWYYRNRRLNVFAAIDFAFSVRKKADFSAIVVAGIDSDNNIFILEIDRFKTSSIKDYFDRILHLHTKWDFRKLRAEVSVAQEVIVKDIKENYIRKHGLALTIDDHRPNRHQGSKEERMEAALTPRYQNKQVYHYLGGNCSILEEELVLQHPPHDDIKDCLSSLISIMVAPSSFGTQSGYGGMRTKQLANSRFGGIA